MFVLLFSSFARSSSNVFFFEYVTYRNSFLFLCFLYIVDISVVVGGNMLFMKMNIVFFVLSLMCL